MAGVVNECIPFKRPGEDVTCTPSTAVTGKKFVAISGNKNADGTYTIAPPAAAGRVFGVAAYNAAIGAKVPVIRGTGEIVPVTCVANIAAFEEVMVDNTGAVTPLTGVGAVPVGFAVTGATSGGDAQISLY